jgi:hypothetical protein
MGLKLAFLIVTQKIFPGLSGLLKPYEQARLEVSLARLVLVEHGEGEGGLPASEPKRMLLHLRSIE